MRRILPLLAAVATVCALPQVSAAQEEPDALVQAAADYARGDFRAATQGFQQALDEGYDGPRVRYNLANALYRDGRIGAAIAHYLAAATLAPRDGDIRANLQRALMERPQGPPAPSPSWLHALLAAVVGFFTLSEFAGAAALLYWLGAIAGTALLLRAGRQRTLRRAAIACVVLATVAAGLGFGRWWAYHRSERAVVAVESAPVHTGPGRDFEATQSLTEGWIVRIHDRDAGWAHVTVEGGSRGWIEARALAPVDLAGSNEEQEARD